MWYTLARIAGRLRPRWRKPLERRRPPPEAGISVVIPSRNGRELLAAQFPGIVRDLAGFASEIIVVDNGSSDGTEAWLHSTWPETQVEISSSPLSFAGAVNRGIARARYSHVCLLNNDMILATGFFHALRRAFSQVPGLFCATAQILFPKGVRREETGKAVYRQPQPDDFPVWCDEPLPGEDLSYVLYGSGGCSLYDAAKLHALGDLDEAYRPVYVEDLDIGFRAWQRGWPSVYVAGAVVEHRHRATSSRYYTAEQLEEILEINYLKFLARAVADEAVFRRLWEQALRRLRLRASRPPARRALRQAARIALAGGPLFRPEFSEEHLLALANGSIAVFPGRAPSGRPCKVVTEMENDPASDQVLVTAVPRLEPPAPELLARYVEVVMVAGGRESLSFRAACEQSARKWSGSAR